MTPEQIALIKKSYERVVPMSEEFAFAFYNRLFKIAPEVAPLFKGDMKEQGEKLTTMLGVVVNSLDKLEAIVPAAQQLAIRHKGYGVIPKHYDFVGDALLWTLEQSFGRDFTMEYYEAWSAAYGVLANTMIEAAEVKQAS